MPDHLFDIHPYMPHGQCYMWQSDLLMLHVVSDALIVLSYYSIPFALLYILKKRLDIPFSWIYWLFGLFIFLCGTTHLLSIWNVWIPDYWLSGFVKLATAMVSISTAALVWPLVPKILAIPSQAQLVAANSALAREIENHKNTERELRKLTLAMQYSSSMVMVTDAQTQIEYCNPAFYQITGYTADEVIGRRANLLKSDLTAEDTYKNLWTTLLSGTAWHGEFLNRKKNGELFWCLESIAPILADDNSISHFVSIIHDISDRKDTEEIIRHMAYYDPLTDLANRSLFNERLEQAIHLAKRNPQIFALFYLDLDRFKNINDTLGHLVGDKLLIEVGKRIAACLRQQETVARLGGDEFALISLNLTSPADAGDIAQRVINTINEPYFIDDHQLFVGTSLGISVYPQDANTSEQLLKHADDALYLAKQHGRNTFEFYNAASNALSLRRLNLENHLRHGLARNEFSLVYQPQVDLASGSIIGSEVLLRWTPAIGAVGPDEFIPIAENSGLIVEIGEWVIRTACRDYMCSPLRERHLFLAINLSARQFKKTSLVDSVGDILRETGFPAERLELEITESMLVDDIETAIKHMQDLKNLGIRLAIDDFGTGFSSLSYLKRFPVDTLKIDKSFVADIYDNQNDACIVRSIIGLGHGLNLKVQAEGVETEQQLTLLKQNNCDRGQGYFFHKPLPIDEFRRLFARF
ncbi:putative bifunctional diguanylate cyclase/phosphodiesterase [Methylomonas koyamae]|uniref:putative bifunctional diguanylate cyclase/phosphodiesterase n=1 Tax=Methylomonas koyamae TaxID=702114 RepID=UPI001126D12C|nr:EAL domain-containing protein [Methylomonas koyamae]